MTSATRIPMIAAVFMDFLLPRIRLARHVVIRVTVAIELHLGCQQSRPSRIACCLHDSLLVRRRNRSRTRGQSTKTGFSHAKVARSAHAETNLADGSRRARLHDVGNGRGASDCAGFPQAGAPPL